MEPQPRTVRALQGATRACQGSALVRGPPLRVPLRACYSLNETPPISLQLFAF